MTSSNQPYQLNPISMVYYIKVPAYELTIAISKTFKGSG